GLLDYLAAGLYGRGGGHGRLCCRYVPPADTRYFQGAAVPRRRLDHSRHARDPGYAQDGRPAGAYADDLVDVYDRRWGAGGHLPAGRLLEQGRYYRARI